MEDKRKQMVNRIGFIPNGEKREMHSLPVYEPFLFNAPTSVVLDTVQIKYLTNFEATMKKHDIFEVP